MSDGTPTPRIRRTQWLALVAGATLLFDAARAETRTYVVSMLTTAMNSTDGDCPKGLNPDPKGLFGQILQQRGLPSAQIETILAGDWQSQFSKWASDRGVIDGKPANIYVHPLSVPDPEISIMEGRSGVGFNLDGRDTHEDFVDPITHEKGVDNELSRVLGCFDRLRGTPEHGPVGGVLFWQSVRDGMPAWLIQVSGIDDEQSDENVEVRILRATESVKLNVAGDVQTYMTFTVDRDPRLQNNVFRGSIQHGTFVSAQPIKFFMLADSFVQPEFDLDKARLRLTFSANGSVTAYLGGYVPWIMPYMTYAQSDYRNELSAGINSPGIFYALRRLADGDPDPKTGARDRISATYQISAVPAFFTTDELVAERGKAGSSVPR
jgi:hypothetical protein